MHTVHFNSEQPQQGLQRGVFRFVFPQFTNHILNNSFLHSCGCWTGEHNGLKCRTILSTFIDSAHNQSADAGFWEGELYFDHTAFDTNEPVLVQEYNEYSNEVIESFYLVSDDFFSNNCK